MANANDDRLDLDAFAPMPAKPIIFKGQEYPVTSFFDLEGDDVLMVLRSDAEMKGRPVDEQIVRLRAIVALLVPTMPEAVRNRLSWPKLATVAQSAWTLSRNAPRPPMGSVEEDDDATEAAPPTPNPSASAPSSPDSVGSTAGATAI